jgi:hypothetical protein
MLFRVVGLAFDGVLLYDLLLLKERPPPLDLASASSRKVEAIKQNANKRALIKTVLRILVDFDMKPP